MKFLRRRLTLFIAILAVLALTVIACGVESGPKIPMSENGEGIPQKVTWQHIRSPLTNRCYEIASWMDDGIGFAGMDEITCSEARFSETP